MQFFPFWLDFPARYVFTFLAFLGFLMVYTMRVNLSVAIVAMVNSSAYATNNNSSSSECHELAAEVLSHQNGTLDSTKNLRGEFNWDPKTQSLILGAFFYGYAVTQIPGGIIAEKWSAKWLFGLGVFITSILTLLSPLAARWNVPAFVAVRIIEGLAEGAMLSSINSMIGRWAPTMERSRLNAFICSGMFMGNIITLPMSAFLSKSHFLGGWPSAFYIFGIFGCVWFTFWSYLIHERPEEHPAISSQELNYVTGNQQRKLTPKVPWKSILSSFRLWALGIAYFGQGWGFYTMITEMPTYLSNVLHFSIEKNGMLSALPYILQTLCSWISSYVADRMRQSGKFSITTIRKIFNSIGFFGTGICLILVTLLGCRPTFAMFFLCAALGLNGFAYSGYKVMPVDMSPRFAGIIMGIVGFLETIPGFLGPYVAGKLTEDGETIHNWGIIFDITASIYFVTGLIFDVFCSAEVQPWNEPMEDLTTNIPAIKDTKTASITSNQIS